MASALAEFVRSLNWSPFGRCCPRIVRTFDAWHSLESYLDLSHMPGLWAYFCSSWCTVPVLYLRDSCSWCTAASININIYILTVPRGGGAGSSAQRFVPLPVPDLGYIYIVLVLERLPG
jgi:hypothetical protein